MRTLIDLTAQQVSALAAICEVEQVSRAEIIRRAISAYLAASKKTDPSAAFGLWQENAVDGLHYQEQARSEW